MNYCLLLAVATTGLAGVPPAPVRLPGPAIATAIEEDWQRQEQRWGRTPGSLESIEAAVIRTEKLLQYRLENRLAPATAQAEINEIRRSCSGAGDLDAAGRHSLYLRIRWFNRHLALADPDISGQPLAFMTRNRFICQMLHEYMGYFYDYGDVSGGGVHILEQPGYSLKTRDLIQGRLPKGNYTTLALSFDAKTIYFAFAERSETKPRFNSPQRQSFHIYSVGMDGSNLRKLTSGVEDDFDPCPLPDGGLAFMSSRRGGFARCNNAWEPCASYTLHRMDADGGNIRTLSRHETSEWHPSVMNDGRLVYIRWDYVDRSAANFHGLWTCNPDGTGVGSLFGNYTMRINACYQPRAIPGSEKLLFIAGAHHADVGGSLVMLDPRRVNYHPSSGEDVFDSIEVLTPEVCFPESAGWPKSYFHSPWPLSETTMLVSFSFDPLPGMSSGENKDTRTGIYYFDRFGNMELLHRTPEASCMYPLPLKARPRPPVIPPSVDLAASEGELMVSDVRQSLFPMPESRTIRELRVFQLLPKGGSHIANEPRIGHANAENARMLLGTVPVEVDGSAYFRVPAGKPIYFQAVDADGRAVQTMRSATYVQPGERRACIGCHEAPGTVAESRPTLAMQRAPSTLVPGPQGSQPFSFPQLVQPIINKHCVGCHDGTEGNGKSKLALTGEPTKTFSRAYENLKPYLRWYEWGNQSIGQIATRPGQAGADASRLTGILDDKNHNSKIGWSDNDKRKLYLWLDANIPFYGTYDRNEQLVQREGKPITPSAFQ